MAVNDIYHIKHVLSLGGILWENDYHYKVVSDEALAIDAAGVAASFVVGVGPKVMLAVHSDVTSLRLEVINLNNDLDFTIATYVTSGALTGDYINPFYVAYFRLHRSIIGRRSGRKAYSGISESQVVNGNPTAPYLVTLGNLATELAEVQPVGAGSIAPAILRSAHSDPPVPSDAMVFTAASFVRMSTQNTRKR